MAEDRTNNAATAMSVRSVRLPESLWQRLAHALDTVNRERRQPLPMSSLIRALLEEGLTAPELPAFDKGIARPARLSRQDQGAAASEAREAERDPDPAKPAFVSDEVVDQFKRIINEQRITHMAFIQSFQVNKALLTKFYFDHIVPDGPDGVAVLQAIRDWLAAMPNRPQK